MQLAQVGDPRVAGQRRLGVDHALQRALGRAEAAELDERVDQRGIRRQQPRPRRACAPRELEPAAEVVPREREPRARDECAGVARAPRQRRAQQPVGARVEARVARLARLLQVGAREPDARVDRARIGAHGRLEPRDLGVGALPGARGSGERRRGGRGLGPAEHGESRERGGEAGEHGDEAGKRGHVKSVRREDPPRPAGRGGSCPGQAGGWGTGAWAGSTRLSFESNPESGSAT